MRDRLVSPLPEFDLPEFDLPEFDGFWKPENSLLTGSLRQNGDQSTIGPTIGRGNRSVQWSIAPR
jgi:hypothetical protein